MSTDRPRSDPAFLAAYGEVVQELRGELGLERKDLADAAGISYSYLSAIESGQKIPSGTFQSMLADALGVSVPDLLARANDHMSSEPGLSDVHAAQVFLDLDAPDPQEWFHSEPPESQPPQRSRRSPGPEQWMSPSGALEELRALIPGMSPEDAAMVVSMARRLSGADGSQRRRQRPRTYGRSLRRESRTEAYLRVWTMYLDELQRQGIDWARGRRPEPRSYFTTPSPIKGSSMSASFARNHKIRHEMYINRGSREANLELLGQLQEKRDLILDVYGAPLDFEDPGQERRAVRIADYRDGHYSRSDEFESYVEWFVDRGVRLRRAIDAFVSEPRLHEEA
jgi:transcriptional regulator with XRE-family HTH domain